MSKVIVAVASPDNVYDEETVFAEALLWFNEWLSKLNENCIILIKNDDTFGKICDKALKFVIDKSYLKINVLYTTDKTSKQKHSADYLALLQNGNNGFNYQKLVDLCDIMLTHYDDTDNFTETLNYARFQKKLTFFI